MEAIGEDKMTCQEMSLKLNVQSIFGHEVKSTEDQIKSSQVYNEKDAKHNLRFNPDQDSFHGSSIAGEGVKIGT